MPSSKIELYAAPVDGDNNDATSIVPTGAIVCSRVRVDRMFTIIERKIETLGLLNEIREFPQLKFVTNVTRLFLLRDPTRFYIRANFPTTTS